MILLEIKTQLSGKTKVIVVKKKIGQYGRKCLGAFLSLVFLSVTPTVVTPQPLNGL